MKKFLFTLFFFFFGTLTMIPAFAECPTLGGTNQPSIDEYIKLCSDSDLPIPSDTPIRDLVEKIAGNLIKLGSLLAVGAIVWAGVQYTKSFGDDEAMKKAKSTAVYALIGLALLLFSFAIFPIIVNFIDTLGG